MIRIFYFLCSADPKILRVWGTTVSKGHQYLPPVLLSLEEIKGEWGIWVVFPPIPISPEAMVSLSLCLSLQGPEHLQMGWGNLAPPDRLGDLEGNEHPHMIWGE